MSLEEIEAAFGYTKGEVEVGTIIITPLDEVNGFHEVQIKRPMVTETQYMTPARLVEVIEAAKIYCQNNKYRLVLNFTGGFDIPELRGDEEV